MSILDSIYKSSSNVAESLDTTAETLQTMSKMDKQEYSEDKKFRKYQKERDKKDKQDRAKVLTRIDQRLGEQRATQEEAQDRAGGGMGLAAAGLAAIIAGTVKKYVKKNPKPSEYKGEDDDSSTTTSTDTNNQVETSEVDSTGMQSGGFAGKVPNLGQPATGDHYYTSVEPGSYILNRNAVSAMGFQSGGSVPVALEQGEIALPPGSYDRGTMDFINYAAFPRFQQGGQVGEAEGPGTDGTQIDAGVAPDPQVDLESIKPGGKIDFLGDGSGFTGKFTIYDGAGKKIADYVAASGIAATASTSQEERANKSGAKLPLPDGQYPLMGLTKHPGQYVGDWSDYINSEGGNIGGRGELLVHPDLGGDGTAGCVGVQLGGSRGTPQEKKFLDIYSKVQPKTINVDLDKNGVGGDGALEGVTTDGTGPDSTGTPSNEQSEAPANPLAGAGIFAGALSSLFGELDSALGLGEFGMSSMGLLFGNPFLQPGDGASGDNGGNYEGDGGGNVGGDTVIDASAGLTEVERKALNVLGKYESDSVGGYNAVNQIGVAGGRGVKGYSGDITKMSQHKGRPLTDFTIEEIMKLQSPNNMSDDQWIKAGRLHAVGRYQFIGSTFKNTVSAMGLDTSQKYTKEVQDRMALHLLRTSPNGIGQWVGPSDHASQAERAAVRKAREMKQAGGPVKPVGRGIDKLQEMIKEEVANFFEQSNLSNEATAMQGEPTVVFAGGGSGGGSTGTVAMQQSRTNLPSYDISPRDNCPLSMYYIHNPSFNPMGIGVQ